MTSYNKGTNNPNFGSGTNHLNGKCLSEEHKRHISEGHKGKKFTKKHRQNISKSKKGKPQMGGKKKGCAPTAGSFKSGKDHPLYGKRGLEVPAWKGGLSKLPYAFDFDKELKILIRKRDKHTCQLCQQRKWEKNLSIHHIDYDKQNSDPENLITLCRSCHSETNSDREVWMRIFKLKLKLCRRKVS